MRNIIHIVTENQRIIGRSDGNYVRIIAAGNGYATWCVRADYQCIFAIFAIQPDNATVTVSKDVVITDNKLWILICIVVTIALA